MRLPDLNCMPDFWLRDHIEMLERTIGRLKGENTTRSCELIERYGRMLSHARLEEIRRFDGD